MFASLSDWSVDRSIVYWIKYDIWFSVFAVSDLERELLAGINGSCDPANSCLVFMRRITDLNNYVSCKQAAGFLEVSLGPGGQQLPQKEMQDLQEQLVYNKLPEILPHNNIHQFDVLWKYDSGIDKKLHEEYLDDMSHCVKQSLLMTLNNVMNNKNKHTSPALVEEIKQHWTLAKSKVSQFCRQVRSEHMEVIHNYLISNSSKPLVLHGEPGSGKTSLMCQVAVLVSIWAKMNWLLLTHPTLTKWTQFRRRHFQMHFQEFKVVSFWFEFQWSLFLRAQLSKSNDWFRL